MDSLIPLVVLGTTLWVIYDAKTIGLKKGQLKGMESFWWFVGCLILWAAAFPVYFAAWKGQLRGLGSLGPWGWFVGCLALWVVAFPMYLAKRGEFRRTTRVAAPAEEMHPAPGPYFEGAAQRCPFCMEEIKDGALKCKHCGSMLDGTVNKFPEKSISSHA